MQADRMEADTRWVKLLSRQVQSADVDLIATLGSAQITLGEILDLKVGDVVGIDIPESITAEVHGVPLLEGHYGTLHGQYALKVEKILTSPKELMLDDEQTEELSDEQ
jgi:flagellar motor switch protein FliM